MDNETVASASEEMELWFSKATASERDALSALQLLYRFQGDSLGSQWWIHLQVLGFKHNGLTYELPEVAPTRCKEKSYTGTELYQVLDQFAVPQLTSPFQEFPPCRPRVGSLAVEEQEAQDWWQQIRDILVFKRFRAQTEGFKLNHLPAASVTTQKALSILPKKRRSTKRNDAGAELFMRKPKRGKNDKAAAQNYSSKKVRFPTIRECLQLSSENTPDLGHVEKNEAILREDFVEWKFQLVMNHSLLCYGAGSKRTILNSFAEELEQDGESVIVVDGFHKDVTIDGILDLIANSWLSGSALSNNHYQVHVGHQLHVRHFGACNFPSRGEASVVQRACSIAKALAQRVDEKQRGYYLILNGIDGAGLRNATAQEALASLVSYSTTGRGLNGFRLVASVDHVNGPALLWDSSTCARFCWIWKPLHTHRPYVEELTSGAYSDEKSARVVPRHQKDDEAPTEHKAIFTVLASLAPRHTEALQQLAGLQANQMADARSNSGAKSSSWVPYKTLFKQCQFKCVVQRDEQLRRFLQELKDHGVVEENNGDDGKAKSYRIPHAARTLKDILEFSHN